MKDINKLKQDMNDNFVLVASDAGAAHKIYKLAEKIGYKGDIIVCSKERDKEGKLTKCNVPIHINDVNKDIVIIDDICDGGKTFINIVEEIKTKKMFSSAFGNGKIYLIITHGIFSKGFGELQQYFDGIYTTNSYQDLQVEPFVKQLNIF